MVAAITPSASSQDARRQAAVRLSVLLVQNVTDRAAVIDAATADVRGCGPSLRKHARTFASAASSRQRLLSPLIGSLPGRSLLPAAMLQDLTSAWQASAQVDTDLARWAERKIAGGCHRNSRPDAWPAGFYAHRARRPPASTRSPASGTRSPDDKASPPTSLTSSKRPVRFRAASRLPM